MDIATEREPPSRDAARSFSEFDAVHIAAKRLSLSRRA